MKKDTLVSIEYGSAQGLYWMHYAASICYAAVYLRGLSFTNTDLGIVFGFGYGLGFVLSNLMGNWIDRYEKITASNMIALCLGLDAALVLYMYFFGKTDAMTMAVCGLQIGAGMCVGGLLTKQWVDLTHCGYRVDFGITRGLGSLAFTVMAASMGFVVEKYGVLVTYPVALVCIVGEIVVNGLLARKINALKSMEKEVVTGDPLFVFVRNNGMFCLLLIGIMLIFFGHKVPDDYMINVVTEIGGNTAGMGALRAFAALLELPTMLLYRRIARRTNGTVLMMIAMITFSVKAFAFALAPSMGWLFGASCLQLISFALYTPAMVDYVNENVSYENSAKGQTMANSMIALGSVFSSFFGGMLYDNISVKGTLFVGAGVSSVGAILCVIALLSMRKRKAAQSV